jgi:hypothetical protein
MKVAFEKEHGVVKPTFLLYVMISDTDGPDDIDEIRLYNDNAGLSWQLTSDNWTTIEDHDKHWLGAANLRMPPGEGLPKGQFRVQALDRSGSQSDKTFGFDTPATSAYKFPTLTIDPIAETYSVTSEYPENYLLLYYNDGVYKGTQKLTTKEGPIEELRLPSDVYSLALWANDETKREASLTEKVKYREGGL